LSTIGDFLTHPNSAPAKIYATQALYNLDKYCKMSLSGGLAQLVKQRTLKILLREWIENPRVGSSILPLLFRNLKIMMQGFVMKTMIKK